MRKIRLLGSHQELVAEVQIPDSPPQPDVVRYDGKEYVQVLRGPVIQDGTQFREASVVEVAG